MSVPVALDAVTPEWISDVLQSAGASTGAVADVTVTNIGEGVGIFGEIGRCRVSYADGGEGPQSVIVKLPCVEPENLAVAQALGIYEREINFFRDVAPTTPLRTPECHVAELADDGRFVLVLEDLERDYDVGDQVVGADLAQTEAIVAALADMHAHWWETDALHALDWLPVPDAPALIGAVPDIYRAGLPVLRADWADRVPAGLMDIAERLAPRFEELMIMTGGGPQTFAHGDTRLDNVFFAADPDAAVAPVAFIDFQLSLRARGVTDLAYLIGTSVGTDIARDNWESLLRLWHTRITDAGIEYRWDDTVTHYRQCTLFYLVGAMSLIGSFDTGNERGAAMTEAYLTRIANHIVDTDAGAVLD